MGGLFNREPGELIAVGISAAAHCESCMQRHIEHAAACGATQEEILETIEVGIEMGSGRATVAARFALEVMDDLFDSGARRNPVLPCAARESVLSCITR